MEPFINAYKTAMSRYVDFSGRTSPGGFWRFFAVYFAVYVVLLILGAAIASIFTILAVLWVLATLLPYLGASIRRLHDSGKSGWYLLVSFIPLAGVIILIYFLTRPSDGPNEYGAAAQD